MALNWSYIRTNDSSPLGITIPRGTPAQQVMVEVVTVGFTQPAASLPVEVSIDATANLAGTVTANVILYAQKVAQTTASKKDGFTVYFPGGIPIGDKGANTAAIEVAFDGTAPTQIDFGVGYRYA